MHLTLLIESAVRGLLFVNGQFCGPMEREGQTFPAGRNAAIYIQLFPFGEASPLAAALILREGRIERLEPEENAFALCWPDGIVQLEMRMRDQAQAPAQEAAVSGTLLHYLMLRLAGDPQAMRLWMKPQDEQYAPGLSEYSAAVPLRFAPLFAPQRFDDRAGLVRPVLANVAVVDAALAITMPAGTMPPPPTS